MGGFPNLLFTFTFFSTVLSVSQDTLTATQSLATNQTLLSPKQIFELGFFPSSSSKWFLGIWYKNIEAKTVVWVANGDSPLENTVGILKIGDRGNLVLLDQMGNSIWSTNQTTYSPSNPVLQLLDSGNLVLKEANQNDPTMYLWQSFDYPTDTLLPGMKLGWDFDAGIERHLTSWSSTGEDPSTGDYSFKINYHGLPQVFLFNKQRIVYRSGPWNGERFSGASMMQSGVNSIKFTFLADAHQVYYTFSMGNQSLFSRLYVTSNGELQRMMWIESTKIWTKLWYNPIDQCDYYKYCGPFGVCDANASPVCVCMRGFRPKNLQAWNLRDGSDGCVRNTKLDCGGDKFLEVKNVKLPDTTSVFVNRSMNIVECGDLCLKHCNCTAYANMEISNGGSGCVMWSDDLIDIRQYPRGGQTLYVRLAASDVGKGSNKSTNKRKIITVTVSVGTVILVAFVCLSIIYTYHSRSKIAHKQKEYQSPIVNDTNKQVKLDELPIFDFEEVAAATNNFHLANILGKGGFGPVYKGTLQDGQEIAVKRLSRASGQGQEEFMNEVLVISKLQHRNLVKILGCCLEGNEKILIYEFMQNKSLDAFLFDAIQRKHLDWRKRFNIIEGIARGLLYLHRDSRLKIIHRDLKASNILLDRDMNPKISDFGLARIFRASEDMVNTNRVVGTYGYMSPEYAMEGLFSEKSDVYSFGVLILEIVNGRRNSSYHTDQESLSLIRLAWRLWNEENVIPLVDPDIWDSCNGSQIMKCIHIGLLCVQEAAKERPSMTNVVMMLSENIHLPPPKQVAFVHKHWGSSSESSNYKERQIYSHNNVTLTNIQGR